MEKFEQSMDSNEARRADLRLSDFIDCGENAIKMQSITKHTLSLILVLSKVHSRLSYIHTSCCIIHTHRHTYIYCRGISIRL